MNEENQCDSTATEIVHKLSRKNIDRIVNVICACVIALVVAICYQAPVLAKAAVIYAKNIGGK